VVERRSGRDRRKVARGGQDRRQSSYSKGRKGRRGDGETGRRGDGVSRQFLDRVDRLLEYFRSEFGANLVANKLTLKMADCGKPMCRACPHGPYWYRAVFNPKTRKWVFRYLASDLNKGQLIASEKKDWVRYSFYNKEIKNLRQLKKQIR